MNEVACSPFLVLHFLTIEVWGRLRTVSLGETA
jgi:hypothetical protein